MIEKHHQTPPVKAPHPVANRRKTPITSVAVEDQRAVAVDAPETGADYEMLTFGERPQPDLANNGQAAAADTSPEFPPVLLFQAALGVVDLLLSAGYLCFWYLDPERLARTVAGVSGVPLLLGCLAVLTGG